MKCAALRLLGEGSNLPPAPVYKPLPQVDIKPPSILTDTVPHRKPDDYRDDYRDDDDDDEGDLRKQRVKNEVRDCIQIVTVCW